MPESNSTAEHTVSHTAGPLKVSQLRVGAVIDLLTRVDDFLDNYVDVDDGNDGRPVANTAMSLQIAVREGLSELRTPCTVIPKAEGR